ncbi:MAG: hypothetical protein H3C58_02375 [Fimbriimonadaceae bacterium]|nr:hypothetical protein [Fimbriimonadaceae bacterium]
MAITPLLGDRLQSRTFVLKRKIMKLVGADFLIFDDQDRLVLFVHQMGFKLKEDIRAYTDETKQVEVLRIAARQVVDFASAYDVFDSATGQRIAVLQRMGWKSMLRDEWSVCGPNEVEVGKMVEDSMVMAVIRRFVSNLVPQNYDLLIGGERHVDFKQNFNPFTYHLNIVVERRDVLDPRVALAAAVLLAAIEGRQN